MYNYEQHYERELYTNVDNAGIIVTHHSMNTNCNCMPRQATRSRPGLCPEPCTRPVAIITASIVTITTSTIHSVIDSVRSTTFISMKIHMIIIISTITQGQTAPKKGDADGGRDNIHRTSLVAIFYPFGQFCEIGISPIRIKRRRFVAY